MPNTTQPPSATHTTTGIHLSITFKLFLAICFVCLLMATAIGTANRLSFDTSFLDYLSEQEQARLSAFGEELAEEYAQKQSWEFIQKDPNAWRKHINRLLRQNQPSKKELAAMPETEKAKRTWETTHLRSSLGLVEKDKQTIIAGAAPTATTIWQPITLENKVIAWLIREPLVMPTDKIDIQFLETQNTTTWSIIAFAMVLASIASVFLSRSFLAPVKILANTTNTLASGNLSARVNLQTGDELATLGSQLNQLAETLQKNENARKTFMAEISHDLRTPLAILHGEIEALQDGVRPLTKESLASLQTEVTMLTRLVNDIHALSLADLGTLAYEKIPFNVVDTLKTSLGGFTERYAAKRIDLQITLSETPLILLGDASRFAQVVHNLMENSLRYTYENGCTQVLCKQHEQHIIVDILDSAPTVPEDQLPRLFERFRTADKARNRHTSGSGLGLAICQSIITAHGGTIKAWPSPLGGIWFRITLPLYTNEALTS